MGDVDRDLVERILARCVRTERGCLEWQGAGSKQGGKPGHGRIKHRGKLLLPHRVILEDALGKTLPRHTLACHECDNPPCCEVTHLFPGTHAVNAKDAFDKGRMKVLPRGSAVSESNRRRWAAWREANPRPELKPMVKAGTRRRVSKRMVKWGDEVLTGAELGRRFGISRQEVARLVKKGWFPLDDAHIRATQARVDRLIAEHRQ